MSEISGRVKVWNNTNPLGQSGTAFVTPQFASDPFDTAGDRQNFGAWFCNRAASHFRDDVRYVLVARGGTSILQWETAADEPDMYTGCTDVYGASGLDPADVFLWHQGESDRDPVFTGHGSGISKSEYKTRFLQLVSDLKSDDVLKADAKVLVGGLANVFAANIDEALQELADENADIGYVSVAGIPTTDGVHFTGSGYVTLGGRYWFAYAKMAGINLGWTAPSIRFADRSIKEMFVGSQPIKSAYLGDVKVFGN